MDQATTPLPSPPLPSPPKYKEYRSADACLNAQMPKNILNNIDNFIRNYISENQIAHPYKNNSECYTILISFKVSLQAWDS
jgi:hypothetical protein